MVHVHHHYNEDTGGDTTASGSVLDSNHIRAQLAIGNLPNNSTHIQEDKDDYEVDVLNPLVHNYQNEDTGGDTMTISGSVLDSNHIRAQLTLGNHPNNSAQVLGGRDSPAPVNYDREVE